MKNKGNGIVAGVAATVMALLTTPLAAVQAQEADSTVMPRPQDGNYVPRDFAREGAYEVPLITQAPDAPVVSAGANPAPAPLNATISKNVIMKPVGSKANNPGTQWHVVVSGPNHYAVQSGSVFTVAFREGLDSKSARVGDAVTAMLTEDLLVGGQKLAALGDVVSGTVTSVDKARHELKSDLSRHHWLDDDGGIGIKFTEIFTASGYHLPVTATPLALTDIENDPSPLNLFVDKRGDICPKGSGMKGKAFDLMVDGASIASGPFCAGVAIGAVAGAIKPSYAIAGDGVKNTAKRRMRGALEGAVEGLPGVGLMHTAIAKGTEVVLQPGDVVTLILNEDVAWDAPESKVGIKSVAAAGALR